MHSHYSIPILVLVGGMLGGVSTAACGPQAPKAVSAVAGLPTYSPEEAALFGDTLGSSVFGLPPDAPTTSTRLEERAKRADAVLVARISTLTQQQLAGKKVYSLTLTSSEPPLAGKFPEGSFELQLGANSPSLARVRAAGETLVGRRLIVFARHYEERGEPVLHWHGEADDVAARTAAQRAKRLDEPQGGVQTQK